MYIYILHIYTLKSADISLVVNVRKLQYIYTQKPWVQLYIFI